VSDWLPDRKLPNASTVQGAFLFVIGVILNQNISGERAWRGVDRLSERIDARPRCLATRSPDELRIIIHQTPAIHPFSSAMSHAIVAAAEQICANYGGDARRIWRDADDGRDVVARMTAFRQIGKHKAEVAVYLLTTVYDELAEPETHGVEAACPALLTYLS
jgi:uncharacterized HhH-GPD family protein